jgi:O-antigen/teichoic acid export membrane protein
MVGLVMLIVVITAIISAKPVINFLFGKEFLLAIRPFVWLMPGIYFISIQNILVKYLAVKNYPVIIIYTWTISLILNIFLNLYFIRTYGIVGASLASTITYILITIIIIVSAFRFKRREVYKLI